MGLSSVFVHFFSNKFENFFEKPTKNKQITKAKQSFAEFKYTKNNKSKMRIKLNKKNASITTV